jgi:choline dehydrogenase-like flavoprotein
VPPSDPILVVGSGASGVHFAQTALEMGHRVTMLDVGYDAPAAVHAGETVNGLKERLDDPVDYFLGERFESLILPGSRKEYYGFPPSKSYVFKPVPGRSVRSNGFAPLVSHAKGGLAQAWTAGCYPLTDGELGPFPFSLEELTPFYAEIARRIGISGRADDLSPFFPDHGNIQTPLILDEASEQLMSRYGARREELNSKLGFFMGQARLATASEAHSDRQACAYLGRCLWGCPRGALYTPSMTLKRCAEFPGFQYRPGFCVKHFVYNDANVVTGVLAENLSTRETERLPAPMLVLAAGSLATSRIVLESLYLSGGRQELSGLMDNRQVLMPFINLRRLGRTIQAESYQYHQLAIGVPGATPMDYVHAPVTTLNTALIHPILQSVPLGARASLALFRDIHAALGLININFADFRRDENRIGLDIDANGGVKGIEIHYRSREDERQAVDPVIRRFRRFLKKLGCYAPPPMTRWRPMGASVHYAGTLPMLESGGALTTDRTGRCRPFGNLIIADAASFPVLPAKNLTFTLMANATRIAHELLSS